MMTNVASCRDALLINENSNPLLYNILYAWLRVRLVAHILLLLQLPQHFAKRRSFY